MRPKVLDFTRPRRSNPASHWVVGSTGLNPSTGHQLSVSSWGGLLSFPIQIWQIVALPASVESSGQPTTKRCLIERIEVAIGDAGSDMCPGTGFSGSLTPHSSGYPNGPELDPISVSGGYPVYDFFGPIPFTATVQCPDETSETIPTKMTGVIMYAYMAPQVGPPSANVWVLRNPAGSDDACRDDYLWMDIDPVYNEAYCGLEAPVSGRVWRRIYDTPVIIGSGQSLCVTMALGSITVATATMLCGVFVRTHVRQAA